MLEIKLKLSKIKYFIVLIKQRTHHFILMADVTIKNVGLYIEQTAVRCRRVCSMLAICCRLAADKSVASPANLQQIRLMWSDL
jgi:hypothetical protein